MFAGNNKLEPGNCLRVADEVIARATIPKQIVGKMILVQSVAAQCELNCLVGEKVSVTQRYLLPKNAIIRASAESQIVSMVCSLARLIFYTSGMLREGRHT